jgi:hypothetical protein
VAPPRRNRGCVMNLIAAAVARVLPSKTTTPDEPAGPRDYRSRYQALIGKSFHHIYLTNGETLYI